MTQRYRLAPSLACALLMFNGMVLATDQAADRQNTPPQKQVYGRELMTEQERAEHHARMKAAKTPEERERVRSEQHERMKKRANERGLTLPDEPPAKRAGKGDHKQHGKAKAY